MIAKNSLQNLNGLLMLSAIPNIRAKLYEKSVKSNFFFAACFEKYGCPENLVDF